MAVPYEQYENEIEAAEDELSLGSDDDPYAAITEPPQPASVLRKRMYREAFEQKWPLKMGIMQLIWGLLLLVLGLLELVVLPLAITSVESPTMGIEFSKRNLWGTSVWSGILLMLTGTSAVRSSVYKSVSSVYIFFCAVVVDILVFSALVILILVGYSHGWTKIHAFPDDVALFYVHIVVSVCLPLGLVMLLLAFLQYYEDVFCGDLQLCRRGVHCCCPCWCPRVVEPEELLDELIRNRPPSLPV